MPSRCFPPFDQLVQQSSAVVRRGERRRVFRLAGIYRESPGCSGESHDEPVPIRRMVKHHRVRAYRRCVPCPCRRPRAAREGHERSPAECPPPARFSCRRELMRLRIAPHLPLPPGHRSVGLRCVRCQRRSAQRNDQQHPRRFDFNFLGLQYIELQRPRRILGWSARSELGLSRHGASSPAHDRGSTCPLPTDGPRWWPDGMFFDARRIAADRKSAVAHHRFPAQALVAAGSSLIITLSHVSSTAACATW